MKLEQGRLAGKVEIFENGNRSRVLEMSGAGKFDQKLNLNSEYEFVFSQEGYVTKKIAISTIVPEGRASAEPFAAFEFQVTLFKQYEGVNFVVFNQAVGRIHYVEEDGDFGYDTDYTKSIQERLEQVEKEVEEKKKEEAQAVAVQPPVEEKKPEPVITEDMSIKRVAPPTTPRRKFAPPPPPPRRKPLKNVVVLHSYTAGEMGYPNLNAYGFINFGDGTGIREITKEQFDEYEKLYH